MSARIEKELALQHINHYRKDLPEGELKSVWLDAAMVEHIVSYANRGAINGLRIYLARYKGGVEPTVEDASLENQQTIIVVPTIEGSNGEPEDVGDAYFNYALPCPENCRGDAGV